RAGRCGRLLRPGNPGGGRGPAGLRNLPGRTRGQRGQPDLRAVPCLLAAGSLSEDPTQDKALILVSVIADSRPVWSSGGNTVGGLWEGQPTPELLRLLARFALSFRPPTGFLRDFVVEHSGERRGQLDLKHGGMIPIVDLARWAGMAAGMASASTRERLRAAEAAGTMDSAEAQTLTEAFGFIFTLRLDHQ